MKPNPSTPHIRQVIVTYEQRGAGKYADPIRKVLHVWTQEGELLATARDEYEILAAARELLAPDLAALGGATITKAELDAAAERVASRLHDRLKEA